MSNRNKRVGRRAGSPARGRIATEPWEAAAAEGTNDVRQACATAEQALEIKRQLLEACLREATKMAAASAQEPPKLRLADGGAMFVASDLSDYLSDGEPFTAFLADGDGYGYEAAMRVYQDEDDAQEGSVSADVRLTRYPDDESLPPQILTEDGWADVEEEEEEEYV